MDMDNEVSRGEAEGKLWSMIKGIRVAMMTTWDGHHMRSRPMHGYQEAFAGELFFFTKRETGKTHEVARYDQLNLSYSDQQSNTFVSIAGRGEVVQDRALMERYWNSHVSAWFPKGLDDPDIALLKVVAEGAEYWDGTTSAMRYFWQVAKANAMGAEPDLGENAKVSIGRG